MRENPKAITILGGTGTLGQALIKEISTAWPKTHLTVVSRDEHKQAAMKKRFPKVEYRIGDIRDAGSVTRSFENRDVVFNVAALKHVDIAEENPLESIHTNVEAAALMADLAQIHGVKHFVFSSTDKAVDPINTYGYCKAVAEKVLFNLNQFQKRTKFSVYRWGNVLGSQGSAIPYFAKTLREEGRAYVTHQDMTRFWIPIEWAVRYMLRTLDDAKPFEAMVPPNMKSAKVLDIVRAVAEVVGVKDYGLIFTGIRPGEKIHETLFSQHSDSYLTSFTADRYTHEELVNMLAPLLDVSEAAA